MRDRIEALASSIRSAYEGIRQKARAARGSDPSLVVKIQRVPTPSSVCAVDGGLLAQRMHGADIVVSRAVGVNFIYSGSTLSSFSYHPSKSPEPNIEMKSSLDEHEANVFRSLVRLKAELSCAIACIENISPPLLLMDGSLLPLPSDRPEEKSEVFSLYSEVLSLYTRLFAISKEKNCMLCGVIKDSRARKLSADLSLSCSDTLLCGYLLEQGERTKAMAYFEDKKGPKEVLALGEKIQVLYMKPSEHDLPLRIETYDCDIDRAVSAIQALSSISENFAYPAVLIEADMCAALDPKEMEPVESSLLSLSGLRPLKRDSRPFR